MNEGTVFEVSRKLPRLFGWLLIFMGVGSLFGSYIEGSFRLLFGAFILLPGGVPFILAARNVKEIVVGKNSVKFLPIGAELNFSEIERMFVPSWADRFDTPPNSLIGLTFATNTDRSRYVPGAVLQWKNGCRINFYGCDGNKMLKVLRTHIKNVEIGL